MVLEMMMESLFAVADMFFVAKLGPAAMATVGLTEAMLTMVYSVAIGISMSVTATVARRIGEQRHKDASKVAFQTVVMGVGLALVIGLVGVIFAPQFLSLMGASDDVITAGSTYTRILLGTNVVIMLLFLNNAVFRGAGDASVAMRSLWLANGLNLILDPCLIFGLWLFPEMGLTGAAVATSIGRGSGVLYQLWHLFRGQGRIQVKGDAVGVDLGIIKDLLKLSIGGIGQFVVACASWVLLVRIVSSFGDAATAGYTLAIRIVIFAFMPAWGLSNSAATLVGQNLGAGQPDRAEKSVWMTGFYNMCFLGAVTLVFCSIPDVLVRLFTDEAEVLPIATDCLRIISYGYVFYAWEMVMVQAFNGSGDTMTPTKVNLGCFWFFQVPLAWFMANKLDMGPPGVFWAVAISYSVAAIVAMILFKRGKWKTRVV